MFKSIFSLPPSNINLTKMFDEINEEHFNGVIKKIPVRWDDKIKVTAGACYYKPNTKEPTLIKMSSRLFRANKWDIKKITRTLIHEMTHAYLLQEFQEAGHTARFQSIMTRITGENKNHRCHDYDVSSLQNKKNVRFFCLCGKTDGRRSRMPKDGLLYRSRCCGSIITFERL
tara:strand:- start:3620 stop:4135 length:516 start_codon:yes stop_codon:yes gene_type:complete